MRFLINKKRYLTNLRKFEKSIDFYNEELYNLDMRLESNLISDKLTIGYKLIFMIKFLK